MKYFILIPALMIFSCGSVESQFDPSDFFISFDQEKVSAQGYEVFGAEICNHSQERMESVSASISDPLEVQSIPSEIEPTTCDSVLLVAKVKNPSNLMYHSLVIHASVNGDSYRFETEFKMEITTCGSCLLLP